MYMANFDDSLEVTEVVSDDSGNHKYGLGSKAGEVRDVLRDDDGSAVAVGKRVVETETVIESIFDSDCGLVFSNGEKALFGDFRSEGDDDITNLTLGGVVDDRGRDEKADNGEVYSMKEGSEEGKKIDKGGRNSWDVEANGNGNGNGRWNGENMEDGNHGFRVGDFVWGKIKSYPWWPGQVYDPRDASDFAIKHSQKGRLLVAFFGDNSCSWCLPSQLVPFITNFEQMSMDGTSRSVINAIHKAVDEVGRLVESNMICKCVPVVKKDLSRPVVANAGVRTGVLAPEVDVNLLPIPEYAPCEILTEVMGFAKVVTFDNAFKLGILRSWLSAFYYSTCGSLLAVYTDPVRIEGLEDNNDNEVALPSDFSVPIEVPIQGPQDDEIYQRRKQKSVAELMGRKTKKKSKNKKRATLDEVKDDGKSGIKSTSKRQKSSDGEPRESVSTERHSLTKKSGSKKRKVKAESENRTEKPKKIECFEEDEMENVSSPRERKKSKYFSPPYTDLSWTMQFHMESESEENKTRASSHVSNSDDEASDVESPSGQQQKRLVASSKSNAHVVEKDGILTFPMSDVDKPVSELLSEIELAAIDSLYLRKKVLLMRFGRLSQHSEGRSTCTDQTIKLIRNA